MAFTPEAWRPIGLTLEMGKRKALPCCVAKMTWSLPPARRTQESSSPLSRPIAINPDGRTASNSFNAMRLIFPLRVAIMQNSAALKSGTGTAAVIVSPLLTQDIDDGSTTCCAVGIRDTISFLRIHLAAIREEEDGVQSASRRQDQDFIFTLGRVA